VGSWQWEVVGLDPNLKLDGASSNSLDLIGLGFIEWGVVNRCL
tara:strand:+ start:100 stop:228 length:129 start_codon:yes stop_codon:yes gene_type:complete